MLLPLLTIAQGTSSTAAYSVDQFLYAIPFLLILTLLYTFRSAKKKMLTLGIPYLKVMTLLYLLSGSSKDPGHYKKQLAKRKHTQTIHGKY